MENDEQCYMFRLWYWSNWGLSMFRYDQFKMLVDGRENKSPIFYIIVISVFSTVNVFLEGDRAGSWWKTFIFLDEACKEMEESLRCSLGSPTTPPLNVILMGPHSNINAMGPEFLATTLRANTFSGPSTVYHLVFTPYSPFLTVTLLKSFSPDEGGRFTIDLPHKQVPLLQAIDDACNVQCHAPICHTRRIIPRSFAN